MSTRVKKGVRILVVNIAVDGTITALDESRNPIALTRSRRIVLANYKNPSYVDIIRKEFNNPNILSDEFTVVKNGETVYTYTK